MTKGKNKNLRRRKIRRSLKNVDLDIGTKGTGKQFYSRRYGCGVHSSDYPRMND